MSKSKSVWNDFEKFLGHQFPECIKKILSANGLDNSLAFDLIDTKVIDDLEKFVETNRSILTNSVYENQTGQFKFLFGHRLLIQNIPKKYKEYCDSKKNARLLRKGRIIELTDENTATNQIGEQELVINLLLLKLNNYANKYNLKYKITADQVKKYKHIDKEARCEVRCPFCHINVPCSFVSHWRVSNLIKHIRSHGSQHGEAIGKVRFQRARDSVLSELDVILK